MRRGIFPVIFFPFSSLFQNKESKREVMNSSERCVKTQAKKGTAINMKFKKKYICIYVQLICVYIVFTYIHIYV